MNYAVFVLAGVSMALALVALYYANRAIRLSDDVERRARDAHEKAQRLVRILGGE